MSTALHPARALIDTFLAPQASFTAVRERPAWAWLALATVAAASAASVYALMSGMSPEWIVEQQLASMGELPAAEIDSARATLLEVAPWSAHLGAMMGVVTLPVVTALLALVYLGAERAISTSRHRYGHWFAATAFSLLPLALNALGLVVLGLARSRADVPLDLANYASLNNLVFGLAPNQRGYTMLSSANVFYLWNIALIAVAARVWCALDWARALLLAALPYLLVFVSWALLS